MSISFLADLFFIGFCSFAAQVWHIGGFDRQSLFSCKHTEHSFNLWFKKKLFFRYIYGINRQNIHAAYSMVFVIYENISW